MFVLMQSVASGVLRASVCQLSLSRVGFSPRMASGMQEKQFTPSLLNFFVYNPTFGQKEGEVRMIPRTKICLLDVPQRSPSKTF